MSDATETPSPPPEEPEVEIHKPKPVHNWRELLTEIGIIVIGVCIALGAEQAVEWLHWRERTQYATEQVQRELADNMTWSMERIMVADCIARRLDDLEQKLLAGGAQWAPLAPMGITGLQEGDVLAVPERDWADIAWSAAIADTSVTHFERERLAYLAHIYGQMAMQHARNQREFENVSRLNILLKPVTLSADTRTQLLEAIAGERRLNRGLALTAARQVETWKMAGLDPVNGRARVVQTSTTYAACRAMQTPRRSATSSE
jgi:hypothetical protein